MKSRLSPRHRSRSVQKSKYKFRGSRASPQPGPAFRRNQRRSSAKKSPPRSGTRSRIIYQVAGGLTSDEVWEKYRIQLLQRFKEDRSAPKHHLESLPEQFEKTPPRSKKIVEWVVKSYVDGGVRAFEDLNRLKIALDAYYYLLGANIITEQKSRNLNTFCGLIGCRGKPGVEAVLDQYRAELAERDRKRQTANKYKVTPTEYKIFYDDRFIRIITPLTQAAACSFGAGTKWCTAATKGENPFPEYIKEGPIYIIESKDGSGNKYQIQFESDQFKDENDTPIDMVSLLDRYPSLLSVPVIGQKIIPLINILWVLSPDSVEDGDADTLPNLPDYIDKLSSLTSLQLRLNHDVSTIPTYVGKIGYALKELNLAGNHLKALSNDPNFLADFTALEVLNLEGNLELDLNKNPELAHLPNLKRIYITYDPAFIRKNLPILAPMLKKGMITAYKP